MQQEEMVNLVVEAVCLAMQETTGAIVATTPLQELKGFDSLLVANLLERLESHLGFEMDPALILPETFVSPLTIAAALMQSQLHMQNDVPSHQIGMVP